MLELKTLKDHKNNPDAFIYMAYDDIFKLLGTKKHIKLTTYLISALCSLNYKDLVNKIIVADVKNNSRMIDTKLEKDLLYLVNTPNKFKISIEMNRISSLNKNIIDRNLAYLADAYTTGIQTKDNYKDLIPTIQFNLNMCDVKKQKHVKNCYLVQDDSLKSLTDKLKIYHVNILKLYKMWYDKSIKKEDLYFKKLCFMGALLLENEWTKFYELLDNAPSDFDDELKNEVKEMLEYMNDDSLLVARFYDPDKRREFYMEGFREEGREQGREEERLQGRKEGEKNGIFSVALNMFKKKYKIEDIEEVTGLSKEEIIKLKEEN